MFAIATINTVGPNVGIVCDTFGGQLYSRGTFRFGVFFVDWKDDAILPLDDESVVRSGKRRSSWTFELKSKTFNVVDLLV